MRRSTKMRYLISYLTDVEGDMSYFRRFVAQSKVLGEADGKYIIPNGRDHFVFGGDSFDLGGEDLTFHDALLQLKRDYPRQVHLLLGNRDVNKMIFRTSVGEWLEGLPPAEAHRRIYPVESPIQRKGVTYEAYLSQHNLPPITTLVTLVKWILKHRMAAPNVLEDRRKELEKRGGGTLSDEEVVRHILSTAQSDDGAVTEYIRHGQLAALIGRALFVHGGVCEENVGYVPFPFNAIEAATSPTRLPGETYPSAADWVRELNLLKEKGFNEWLQSPRCAPCGTRTGGEFLHAYAFRYTPVRYSVMVNSFVDFSTRQLREVDRATEVYLKQNNIDVVCCGHQPSGDSPTVLQTEARQFIVMGDNSYCAADNSRGRAITEVLVEQDDDNPSTPASVRLRGCRTDGTPFDFILSYRHAGATPLTPLLGKRWNKQWWAKIPSPDGGVICQCSKDAFYNVDYKTFFAGRIGSTMNENEKRV
ncbi:hypothetical protein AGDE_09783 [Angomonas deanei]|uniref:Calcineurin-like phosphoesterase, putative n=1 Tax=Angomonas deanei TaxID=59799 RepID=A0A7G2CLI8_9TRYP|nr:hypothetical protein AGDE_09783 [Angomonas deanei]CAD2219784.1 Calcineurin-like phosphoesterase, putative [Angomonas deanei]|eukprot:EPY29828.1 hypothetical protein AGDE_09783 [Angomonas deanei]